jgi:probable phosphoglycerate mutase
MTEIILIRHGETAWNAIKRLQGHLDIALNAAGMLQAKALAAALQHEKIDAIISSDLQRARQTAGEIALLQGVDIGIDANLRERCYGGFEGFLYSELAQRFPHEYALWQSHDPDARFPPMANDAFNTGESIRQFQHRIVNAIMHHALRFEGRKIALIAHGGVLECAYRAAKNLALETPREVTIFNASINRFLWNGENIELVQWGDVAHLDNQDAMDEFNQGSTK